MSEYLDIVLDHAVEILEAKASRASTVGAGIDVVDLALDLAMRRRYIQHDSLKTLASCLNVASELTLPAVLHEMMLENESTQNDIPQDTVDKVSAWLRGVGTRKLREAKTAGAALNVVWHMCRSPILGDLLSSSLPVRRLASEQLRVWATTSAPGEAWVPCLLPDGSLVTVLAPCGDNVLRHRRVEDALTALERGRERHAQALVRVAAREEARAAEWAAQAQAEAARAAFSLRRRRYPGSNATLNRDYERTAREDRIEALADAAEAKLFGGTVAKAANKQRAKWGVPCPC